MLRLAQIARTITEDDRFRSAILGLIVLNALCLGVEAVPELEERYSEPLAWILTISQAVFVIESHCASPRITRGRARSLRAPGTASTS